MSQNRWFNGCTQRCINIVFLLMGPKKPFSTKTPYFAVSTVSSLLYIGGSVYAQQITISSPELLLISILLLWGKMQIMGLTTDSGTRIYQLVLFSITLAYRIYMIGNVICRKSTFLSNFITKTLNQMFPVNYNYAMRYF